MHQHPDVTMDCIAMGRSMPAWEAGEHQSIRATLAESAERLARAGAGFFVCPDNTAHMALALPGLHIAEVVAAQAARDGRTRVGVLGARYTMEGPVYPRVLAAHGIGAETPGPGDWLMLNKIIFDELVNGQFTVAGARVPSGLSHFVVVVPFPAVSVRSAGGCRQPAAPGAARLRESRSAPRPGESGARVRGGRGAGSPILVSLGSWRT